VPLALSQNTVDGLVTTHESANTAKLWDAGVRHAFEDFQTFNQYIPMVSQTLWNKLNPQERETLTRIWEETVDKERGEAAEAQREARDILLRNNISIKTATQQEATEARRRLMATQDQVVAEIGIDRELVAGVLREIRAAGVGV
jgi:C4-dicarboxylate-binding protein DctP